MKTYHFHIPPPSLPELAHNLFFAVYKSDNPWSGLRPDFTYNLVPTIKSFVWRENDPFLLNEADHQTEDYRFYVIFQNLSGSHSEQIEVFPTIEDTHGPS